MLLLLLLCCCCLLWCRCYQNGAYVTHHGKLAHSNDIGNSVRDWFVNTRRLLKRYDPNQQAVRAAGGVVLGGGAEERGWHRSDTDDSSDDGRGGGSKKGSKGAGGGGGGAGRLTMTRLGKGASRGRIKGDSSDSDDSD